MKKSHFVLSVVVLVLAITGLVFSILFFSKKGDFTDGWKKLAASINRNSSEMDKNGGTEYAKDLSSRNLQHEKYAQMDRQLVKLQAQSRAFTKSRDTLAQAAAAISKKAGVSKFTDASLLCKVNDPAAVDEMSGAINAVYENRDRSYANAATLAKGLGYTMSVEKLIRGENDALDPFAKALAALALRRDTYEETLKSIAVNVGANSLDLSEGAYKTSSEKVVAALAKFQNAHEKLAKDLDQVRAENQKLSAQDKEQKDQLTAQKKVLADRDRQLAGFKEALKECAPTQDPRAPWLAGSREAKAALVGKVIKVDEDYGLVTIDAGCDTTVSQKIAAQQKPNVVKVELAIGDEAVIVRGDISKDPEYLTCLKLEKVGKKESVGRIPAGCTSIRKGDQVIFRPAQVAANK